MHCRHKIALLTTIAAHMEWRGRNPADVHERLVVQRESFSNSFMLLQSPDSTCLLLQDFDYIKCFQISVSHTTAYSLECIIRPLRVDVSLLRTFLNANPYFSEI